MKKIRSRQFSSCSKTRVKFRYCVHFSRSPTSQIFRKFDLKISNCIKEFGLLYRKYGRFSWVQDTYEAHRYILHVNFIKISPMKYHVCVNPKNGMFLNQFWYALNIFNTFLGSRVSPLVSKQVLF